MGLGDGSTTDDDDTRRRRLLGQITAIPGDPVRSAEGRPPGDRRRLLDRLARICSVSLPELDVSGAGVTVMGSVADGLAGHRTQLCATDDVVRRLEDLQLTTGEGPCLDAYAGGAPVLVGDLAADGGRWLAFGHEAVEAGAAAAFSLPLQVGAVRLGTLDLHRDRVGALTRDQLADALVLAEIATETLLELSDGFSPRAAGDRSATGPAMPGWLPDVHAEVHQASGMVAAREGIPVTTALLRIRAHAYGRDVSISEVARRILSRETVLENEPDDP